MTPQQWYKQKRDQYQERYGKVWAHLYVWPPVGETQNSKACETALRSGIECRVLQANGPAEIEMVANAIMIRELLKRRRNSEIGVYI